MPPIEIYLDRPANGGASVGRDENGRAVFCEGGLPGETVRVNITSAKKRFARGQVIEVLNASPDRVQARCATHHLGCGGCDLAHATPLLQRQIKRQVVVDSLVRIGGIDADHVDQLLGDMSGIAEGGSAAYRTTVRAAIVDGRAGYRKRASHSVVAAEMCRVAHPLLEDLLLNARFGLAAGGDVVMRVSASTSERIAIVDEPSVDTKFPDDVVVVSRAQLDEGADVHITEFAAERDWRVSAGSFFQAGPEVATELVDAVRSGAGDLSGATVVDAYSGVGLFAGTLGTDASTVYAVERAGSSTADARINLAGQNAVVVESPVESWTPVAADVVIADPARSGLGRDGVATLLGCKAERFVLVACDTGSLGRDVGLLVEAGYSVSSVQLVDAFHDTSHVETIVGLSR